MARPGKPKQKVERAPFILFTIEGERVPRFTDVYNTPDPEDRSKLYAIVKHGYKVTRSWVPGFWVKRRGTHYRVGKITASVPKVDGSVYQLRAWDWQPSDAQLLSIRFPTVASVEMYMRHVHGAK